jgi:hypothetical protein
VPRKNKDGKIIGYRGAFFGPDGKRRWVSAKTKTECWAKLNAAMTDVDRGILPCHPDSRQIPEHLANRQHRGQTRSRQSRRLQARRSLSHHSLSRTQEAQRLEHTRHPPFLPKKARRRSLEPEPRSLRPRHLSRLQRACAPSRHRKYPRRPCQRRRRTGQDSLPVGDNGRRTA